MRNPFRSIGIIFVICALLTLSGCIGGATPMIKRERGPQGNQLPKKAFDTAFVQVGTTTRDEVRSKLSIIDTGVESPRFFWGRWASSKWGYMFAVGGYGAAAGDAGRIWTVHNLVIGFDEKGVTETSEQMGDSKTLWEKLHKEAVSLPSIELTEPITFIYNDNVLTYHLTFTREWIEVVREYHDKSSTTRFTPDKIRRLSHSYPNDARDNPGMSCHFLHLSEKTPAGKKIRFCADGPDVFATFRYLRSYAPADMQWE